MGGIHLYYFNTYNIIEKENYFYMLVVKKIASNLIR